MLSTGSETYVYLAERDGLIKIGFSRNPIGRSRSLGARLLLSLFGTASDERRLHQTFAADRVPGGTNSELTSEWFRASKALRGWIALRRYEFKCGRIEV